MFTHDFLVMEMNDYSSNFWAIPAVQEDNLGRRRKVVVVKKRPQGTEAPLFSPEPGRGLPTDPGSDHSGAT